jgi:anti-sigma factor RsiW
MRCTRVRWRLNAYADDELKPAAARQIAAHLEQCVACRTRLAALHQVTALLANAPEPPPPPPWLGARVMARARSGMLRGSRTRPIPGLARFLSWLAGQAAPMRLATALTAAVAVLVGVATGTAASRAARPPAPMAQSAAVEGIDWFSAAPPGGLAASYAIADGEKR